MSGMVHGFSGRIFSLTICGVLAGCSIHPTPFGLFNGEHLKNVTFKIVSHVRCEMRDAFYGELHDLIILDSTKSGSYPGTAKLLNDLKTNREKVKSYADWQIPPIAQVRSSFIQNSSVVLEFILDATETNNHTLSASISPTSSSNPFTLGLGGLKNNLSRQAKSTFELPRDEIIKFNDLDCSGAYNFGNRKNINKSDWNYPMRGNINLAKSVRSFIEYSLLNVPLNLRHGLATDALQEAFNGATKNNKSISTRILNEKTLPYNCKPGDSVCERDKVCYSKVLKSAAKIYNRKLYKKIGKYDADKFKFADLLKFSTTLGTGINPSIEFNSLNASFKLKTLGYDHTPGRVDDHQLTLTFLPYAKQAEDTVESPPEYITIATKEKYELRLLFPTIKIPELDKSIEECLPLKTGSDTNYFFTRDGMSEREKDPDASKAFVDVPETDEEKALYKRVLDKARIENLLIENNNLLRKR